MGFLGEFVSVIRILQRPFRMPLSYLVLTPLIVFGGGAMGVCSKLVLLGGFSVCVMHDFVPVRYWNRHAHGRFTPLRRWLNCRTQAIAGDPMWSTWRYVVTASHDL
jgi:hypothetical protein